MSSLIHKTLFLKDNNHSKGINQSESFFSDLSGALSAQTGDPVETKGSVSLSMPAHFFLFLLCLLIIIVTHDFL